MNSLPKSILNLEEKIYLLSKSFVNRPYKQKDKLDNITINSWNQLKNLLSSTETFYTFAYFDCVTFIETILALTLSNVNVKKTISNNSLPKKFKIYLMKIRFNKKVCYIQQNHFPCIDWEKNNSWLLKNITRKLPNHKIVAYKVNKINWLLHKESISSYLTKCADLKLNKKLIVYLKKHGLNFYPKLAKVPYIPLQKFKTTFKTYLDLLPSIGIVYFVRPNRNTMSTIGTNLAIFHMGFFYKKNHSLLLMQISRKQKRVKIMNLLDYCDTLSIPINDIGLSFLKIHNKTS